MVTKIKDFIRIPGNAKPDSRHRVVLPGNLVKEDIIYHIYSNELGQILLDPQVTIPASEAWIFQNPEILKLVKQGLSDASEGRVSKIDLDAL
jgi:hypothetical protein